MICRAICLNGATIGITVPSYSSSPKVNPTGPEPGTMRVMRGGDWSSAYLQHRVAFRDRWFPDESNFKWGFRLCLSE